MDYTSTTQNALPYKFNVSKLAVSVGEFAELMSVSKPTAYEILRRSDFHGAFKLGKRTLISVPIAIEWIEQMTAESKNT